MAVGTPVGGTTSGAAASPVAPTVPATATDDIIVLWAVFYTNLGSAVPAVITWTAGYTEGQSIATKNASGVATGIAGWAWKRAVGNEAGTKSIACNGTATAAGSNCCTIPGCVTSGDPFETENLAAMNAPSYTATVDWPGVTFSRSTGGLSLIGNLNTDNVNIGTPASWTVLSSNASTGGTDSAVDVDYRAPGATGTFDPANGTQTSANALGWAAFNIPFTDTAAAAAAASLLVPTTVPTRYLI